MKTVLVLAILLCAAFAAPAEDKEKAPEAAGEAPKEQGAAAPEMEKKMVMTKDDKVFVPEDSVPVPGNAHAIEEAAAPASRFNYCPDGWFSYGSRCFLFSNTPMSWYSAQEHCKSLGANLASVTNPREYSFLQQITQTSGQSIAWLGGFNLQGRWMWIDSEGFYYTNWYGLSSSSSHACMYLRTTNGWGNTQCGSTYRFICSKNLYGC